MHIYEHQLRDSCIDSTARIGLKRYTYSPEFPLTYYAAREQVNFPNRRGSWQFALLAQ